MADLLVTVTSTFVSASNAQTQGSASAIPSDESFQYSSAAYILDSVGGIIPSDENFQSQSAVPIVAIGLFLSPCANSQQQQSNQFWG